MSFSRIQEEAQQPEPWLQERPPEVAVRKGCLSAAGGLGSVLACPLAYPLAGAPGTVIGAECESLGASELARHFSPGKSGVRQQLRGVRGRERGNDGSFG